MHQSAAAAASSTTHRPPTTTAAAATSSATAQRPAASSSASASLSSSSPHAHRGSLLRDEQTMTHLLKRICGPIPPAMNEFHDRTVVLSFQTTRPDALKEYTQILQERLHARVVPTIKEGNVDRCVAYVIDDAELEETQKGTNKEFAQDQQLIKGAKNRMILAANANAHRSTVTTPNDVSLASPSSTSSAAASTSSSSAAAAAASSIPSSSQPRSQRSIARSLNVLCSRSQLTQRIQAIYTSLESDRGDLHDPKKSPLGRCIIPRIIREDKVHRPVIKEFVPIRPYLESPIAAASSSSSSVKKSSVLNPHSRSSKDKDKNVPQFAPHWVHTTPKIDWSTPGPGGSPFLHGFSGTIKIQMKEPMKKVMVQSSTSASSAPGSSSSTAAASSSSVTAAPIVPRKYCDTCRRYFFGSEIQHERTSSHQEQATKRRRCEICQINFTGSEHAHHQTPTHQTLFRDWSKLWQPGYEATVVPLQKQREYDDSDFVLVMRMEEQEFDTMVRKERGMTDPHEIQRAFFNEIFAVYYNDLDRTFESERFLNLVKRLNRLKEELRKDSKRKRREHARKQNWYKEEVHGEEYASTSEGEYEDEEENGSEEDEEGGVEEDATDDVNKENEAASSLSPAGASKSSAILIDHLLITAPTLSTSPPPPLTPLPIIEIASAASMTQPFSSSTIEGTAAAPLPPSSLPNAPQLLTNGSMSSASPLDLQVASVAPISASPTKSPTRSPQSKVIPGSTRSKKISIATVIDLSTTAINETETSEHVPFTHAHDLSSAKRKLNVESNMKRESPRKKVTPTESTETIEGKSPDECDAASSSPSKQKRWSSRKLTQTDASIVSVSHSKGVDGDTRPESTSSLGELVDTPRTTATSNAITKRTSPRKVPTAAAVAASSPEPPLPITRDASPQKATKPAATTRPSSPSPTRAATRSQKSPAHTPHPATSSSGRSTRSKAVAIESQMPAMTASVPLLTAAPTSGGRATRATVPPAGTSSSSAVLHSGASISALTPVKRKLDVHTTSKRDSTPRKKTKREEEEEKGKGKGRGKEEEEERKEEADVPDGTAAMRRSPRKQHSVDTPTAAVAATTPAPPVPAVASDKKKRDGVSARELKRLSEYLTTPERSPLFTGAPMTHVPTNNLPVPPPRFNTPGGVVSSSKKKLPRELRQLDEYLTTPHHQHNETTRNIPSNRDHAGAAGGATASSSSPFISPQSSLAYRPFNAPTRKRKIESDTEQLAYDGSGADRNMDQTPIAAAAASSSYPTPHRRPPRRTVVAGGAASSSLLSPSSSSPLRTPCRAEQELNLARAKKKRGTQGLKNARLELGDDTPFLDRTSAQPTSSAFRSNLQQVFSATRSTRSHTNALAAEMGVADTTELLEMPTPDRLRTLNTHYAHAAAAAASSAVLPPPPPLPPLVMRPLNSPAIKRKFDDDLSKRASSIRKKTKRSSQEMYERKTASEASGETPISEDEEEEDEKEHDPFVFPASEDQPMSAESSKKLARRSSSSAATGTTSFSSPPSAPRRRRQKMSVGAAVWRPRSSHSSALNHATSSSEGKEEKENDDDGDDDASPSQPHSWFARSASVAAPATSRTHSTDSGIEIEYDNPGGSAIEMAAASAFNETSSVVTSHSILPTDLRSASASGTSHASSSLQSPPPIAKRSKPKRAGATLSARTPETQSSAGGITPSASSSVEHDHSSSTTHHSDNHTSLPPPATPAAAPVSSKKKKLPRELRLLDEYLTTPQKR